MASCSKCKWSKPGRDVNFVCTSPITPRLTNIKVHNEGDYFVPLLICYHHCNCFKDERDICLPKVDIKDLEKVF